MFDRIKFFKRLFDTYLYPGMHEIPIVFIHIGTIVEGRYIYLIQ